MHHKLHLHDLPPLQSSLPNVSVQDFARMTLSHLYIINCLTAEAIKLLITYAPQGVDLTSDWLVSLKTADSHGVHNLIVTLAG